MNRQVKKVKVFVGLSGGVDSSVSAALLKQQGYDVTGVFIKVWQPDWIECTWKEDRLDAMRVAALLGIPFVTLDLTKEYKTEVVDYMIAEYKAGRTPNPDVMCNRYVKFGGFFKWAMKSGADYVATGHYARVRAVESKKLKMKSRNVKPGNLSLSTCHFQLLAGADKNKDQSYFLWTLNQDQLAHTLFPVGGMEKSEVRRLAKKFGLPTADKKDSQGLCFIGKIDVKEFLRNFIKTKPGKVLNEHGEVIGTHDGAMFFTLGERHGFAVSKNGENQEPYYVVAKDVKKNTLTVSHDPSLGVEGKTRTDFEIKDVDWIGTAPSDGAVLMARLRYRQPLQKVKIIIHNSPPVPSGLRYVRAGSFIIRFASAQSGGASGQSIVLYDGEVCLGGGVIV